jgi:2,4-dienoyl-CoA reductase-like NADH-dependent reductase (Old Yellow Enzyme family)
MSSAPFVLTRVPSLKSPADFRRHLSGLGLELPCDDALLAGSDSPLRQPIPVPIAGRTIGNRWAIHPMEGWDATTDGKPTEEVRRRWRRFGESGAKLIWGGEAMAVRPDGRANPNQLILSRDNLDPIAALKRELVESHRQHHGTADDLVVGFQLTHSGRFCRPNDKKRLEPRIAYRHPILDRKFQIDSDGPVLTDAEVSELIRDYVRAARIAYEAGADFVDLKHCHGYLLHEFLGAHTRPGPYGGSFENRTRILREIVEGIRADGNPVEIGVRLSAFDLVPFRPDPTRAQPGKLGPGIPEDFSACLPYRYGFGMNPENPMEPDLTETHRFTALCASLGIRLLNLSAGSPYYNPHLLRPAAYPPSDGYQPAHDPLIDVARQVQAVRAVRAQAPRGLVIVGSGYTYLQDYLPHVAQAVVREGWADLVGLGRMVLSYPGILADATAGRPLQTRGICRTFSECTTAPRNGLPSGCYPLDPFYVARPEAQALKELKKAGK